MKKLLFILLISPSLANGQAISRLIRILVNPAPQQVYNLVMIDTNSQNRLHGVSLDSVKRAFVRRDSTYTVTRTLDANYIISARSAWVVYSVSILSNAGNTGTVYLEYSPDAVTWSEASRTENKSNGVGNTQITTLCGRIPGGYYVRLRTNAGGTTITYISGQETLL